MYWLAGQDHLTDKSATAQASPLVQMLSPSQLRVINLMLIVVLPLLVLVTGIVWRVARGQGPADGVLRLDNTALYRAPRASGRVLADGEVLPDGVLVRRISEVLADGVLVQTTIQDQPPAFALQPGFV